MPTRAKRYRKDANDQRIDDRKTSHQRGYDKRWRKLRDKYINDHPMCEHCEARGDSVPAREVDHIIEFSGVDDKKRLDESNLQSLCRPCHASKTYADKSSR